MECNRCLLNTNSISSLILDNNGICNYCHLHDQFDKKYPTGHKGKECLEALFDKIRRSGQNKSFDVVVGISGGRDSSYLLHLACKYGLRPMAVHYDNGWDTEIAKANMMKMVNMLEIPLVNYKVRQKEVDDLIKAFLLSHTQDAEAPTDLALVKVAFDIAKTYGIKYILDGHSFRTEGIAPLEWSYMDGAYVRAVHDEYGTVPLETYPSLTLMDQLKSAIAGIERPRPLYYLNYNVEETITFLKNAYGFEWYGGHHLENTYTAFFDYYYRFNKFGYDGRLIELSALIRSDQITKKEAIEKLKEPILSEDVEWRVLTEVKSRLNLDNAAMRIIMNPGLKKTHKNWNTYKKTFKRLKPLFWIMMKTNRIPQTFYEKYVKT